MPSGYNTAVVNNNQLYTNKQIEGVRDEYGYKVNR